MSSSLPILINKGYNSYQAASLVGDATGLGATGGRGVIGCTSSGFLTQGWLFVIHEDCNRPILYLFDTNFPFYQLIDIGCDNWTLDVQQCERWNRVTRGCLGTLHVLKGKLLLTSGTHHSTPRWRFLG